MTDFAKELSDFMTSYDAAKAKWIDIHGSDSGFNEYLLSELKGRGSALATCQSMQSAADIGRKGRAVNSDAQKSAAKANGKKGGRPKKSTP